MNQTTYVRPQPKERRNKLERRALQKRIGRLAKAFGEGQPVSEYDQWLTPQLYSRFLFSEMTSA